MPFDVVAALHAREAQHAQLASLYPLPDTRLDALGGVLADRLRRSGITLPSEEAFATLVLNMARIALYWSAAEVQAREIAAREARSSPSTEAPWTYSRIGQGDAVTGMP